jgi:hypothetical protein
MKNHNNAVCVLVGTEINYSYVILFCCRTGSNSLFSDETTDDKNVVNSLQLIMANQISRKMSYSYKEFTIFLPVCVFYEHKR